MCGNACGLRQINEWVTLQEKGRTVKLILLWSETDFFFLVWQEYASTLA